MHGKSGQGRVGVGNSGGWGRGSVFFVFLMCASLGMAQLDTGTISGTVTDSSGAAVPGAAVAIRNTATGISRSLVTNAAGRYEAAALPGGTYEVRASLSGFQTMIRSGVTLAVGRTAVIDLALQVGEVAQAITVSGEASRVETTTATVSNLVDEKRVADIPLNNRDLTQLAFLQPGVLKMPINVTEGTADVSVAGAGDKFSVAGARATQNVFLLDGVSNSDASGNVASVAGAYEGAETIKEFQVITNNYSAEYPSKPGAIVSAVTKSGTNSFHGSVYEFLRNDVLDAFKWEDKAFTSRPEKPDFKRNHFGGSLGGPILRDKTFFFASYEGLRERQSRTGTARIPSAAAHTGDLGPRGPINPATGTRIWPVNPVVAPYLKLYPIPGEGNNVVQDLLDGTVLVSGAQRKPVRDDFGTVKIDHQFGSPRAGFLAVTYNTSSAERQNLLILPADDSVGVTSRKHVVSARHTSVLSSAALNEFAFGLTRSKTTTAIPITDIDWKPLRWIDDSETMGDLQPGTNITSIGFGPDASFFGHNVLTFKDNLTLTRASHTIKFGAEFQRTRVPAHKEPDGANGRFLFDGLEYFLRGLPTQFDASLPKGAKFLGLTNQADPVYNLRQNQFGFYFQDNWKVFSTLMLNLGLRYEFRTDLAEENNHLSSFRDIFGDKVTVGGPFFKNNTLKNFSPRVGFAWSPGGQKNAVRGGFGIFYAPAEVIEYQYVLGQLAPFMGEGGLVDRNSTGAISFPNAFRTQATQLASAPNYREQEFNAPPTYIYRWSLTLEREMGNWFVSAGYSGARARHLTITSEANLRRWVGWPNNVPSGEKRYPYPQLAPFINPLMGRLTVTHQKGNSYYHGLAVNVMRRLTHGLTLQAAYTLSKALDQSASPGNNTEGYAQTQRTALLWDMGHWLGRSTFDIRHNFVSNVTYDLPRTGLTGVGGVLANGWQMNGIITLSSGHAFGLTDANREQRSAMDRADGLRPNLIPGGNNNPVLGKPDKYYDVSQFVPSVCHGSRLCQSGDPDYAVGYYGNLGSNTLTGPGLATVDFSLNKNFRLMEEKQLQFRAEIFNLFNRPNFSIPDAAGLMPYRQTGTRLEVNPSAGQITSTRTTARQIQFGLRFSF